MFAYLRTWPAIAACCLVLAACGGGGGGGSAAPAPTVPPTPTPVNADIKVLMFGNSHTALNGLPEMLAVMIRAGRPGKTVAVVAADGYLTLDQRMDDSYSRALLASQNWNALVLQAQQYSSSGTVEYSTSDAVEWVRLARLKGSLPVMFPEWPRRGIDETARIYDLHVSIAKKQPACVAPIPQAFDLSFTRFPSLLLHADDGNHSNITGAFLAALVLYSTITGESPLGLPYFSQVPVSAEVQANIRKVVDDQVQLVSPRLYCPNDIKL
jgi:hypothetical protein